MPVVRKIGVVILIAAIGILIAWPFRKTSTSESASRIAVGEPTESGVSSDPGQTGRERRLSNEAQRQTAAPNGEMPSEESDAPSSLGAAFGKSKSERLPPELPPSFDALASDLVPVRPESARPQRPAGAVDIDSSAINPPTGAQPSGRMIKYRIRDGDTLSALAERYLRDKRRAAEIYEANRDRLMLGPHVLPVDVEILIPELE